MASRKLQFAAIFFTVFIDIIGFGIVIPVLPVYAEHFGATAVQIGWLVGIFSLMQFLFAPWWGRVSDRHGRRPVLIIGMVGTAAGYLAMGFAGTFAALFVARTVAGISGANIGAAQAYLADISAPGERARAMGLVGAAFGLGFVFGPALGGWAGAVFHYSAPMFVAATLSVANLFFVAFFVPESLPPGKRGAGRSRFREICAHVKRGQFAWSACAYFSAVAGFSILTTVFALYLLHRFRIDTKGTGLILAGMGVIGAVIQGGMIGRLVKIFGEGALAVTGCLSMAAGLAALAFSENFPVMFASAAFVGIGNSLLAPTLTSLASRAAEPEWQGRALGLLQSAGSLARFLGPMTAGFLLAAGGGLPYASLALLSACGIMILAAAVAAGLTRESKRLGREEAK